MSGHLVQQQHGATPGQLGDEIGVRQHRPEQQRLLFTRGAAGGRLILVQMRDLQIGAVRAYRGAPADLAASALLSAIRSEAHTSELQSLMRISYAVFCLKKNTQ